MEYKAGKKRISFILILVTLVMMQVLPAWGQDNEDPDDDKGGSGDASSQMIDENGLVSLDFTNTDIKEIVKIMSEMTGRNFMIDSTVSGSVTIISPTRVTPEEAYEIFLSVLRVNGFTTVQVGKINKIVPLKDALKNPIPTKTGGVPPASDQMITQLIPLENIDSADIVNAFRNMVGADGDLFAYGPSNMVVISDSANNVNRIYRIIKQLDVKGDDQKVVSILLDYADAENTATIITELLEEDVQQMRQSTRSYQRSTRRSRRRRSKRSKRSKRSTTSTNIPTSSIPVILADTRTNSLVIKSNDYQIERIRELVSKLDQPLPGGESKFHVIYLENAVAEEIAETLSMLAVDSASGNTRGKKGVNARSRSNRSRSSSSRYSSAMSRYGNRGQTTTGRPGIANTTGRLFAQFEGVVQITADVPTNSLVIIAGNRDIKIIRDVIDKLDIPRRQVFVEAVIMEISMDSGLDLGFEFRSTNDSSEDGIQVIGGSNYGGITNAAANPLGMSGFALGAMDGTITYGGTEYPNIGALFHAMQTDSNINVLSTPNLLTMDNEEAEIVVADNIPFITGQIFSANNSNPTTTIERKDVGVTLRIVPQINESDFVRLEIYQESSAVADSPEGLTAAEVGVTTSKRSASTLVVVKDRQTVIIGGLMQDNVSYAEAKIPVLGDIPVLGYLFKTSKKSEEKTNLLLFLTPYIIKDPSDLEEVTRMSNERMRVFREQTRTSPKSDMEDAVINERSLAPSEDTFDSPRTDD